MGLFILFIYISIAIDKLQTALDCNYINQCTGYNLHRLYTLIYYSCSLYNKLFFSVARIRFQLSKLLYRFTDLYTFREVPVLCHSLRSTPRLRYDLNVSRFRPRLLLQFQIYCSVRPATRLCYFIRS